MISSRTSLLHTRRFTGSQLRTTRQPTKSPPPDVPRYLPGSEVLATHNVSPHRPEQASGRRSGSGVGGGRGPFRAAAGQEEGRHPHQGRKGAGSRLACRHARADRPGPERRRGGVGGGGGFGGGGSGERARGHDRRCRMDGVGEGHRDVRGAGDESEQRGVLECMLVCPYARIFC